MPTFDPETLFALMLLCKLLKIALIALTFFVVAINLLLWKSEELPKPHQ